MWGRTGDKSLTHPDMFKLLSACGGDMALRNETYGFVQLLGTIMGQHETDYFFNQGMAQIVGPGRWEIMIDVLTRANWLELVMDEDSDWNWKLTVDEEIFHLRTHAEAEIDRARKRDGRRPELIIPVRVRDGDQCRWCGKSVSFKDRVSARGGTIDSLTGHKDSTVDTLVVACRGCNSTRIGGKELKLLPAPSPRDVFYREDTVAFINASEYAKDHNIVVTTKKERDQLALDLEAAVATGVTAQPAAAVHKHETAPPAAVATSVTAPEEEPDIPMPDWVKEAVEDNKGSTQAADKAAVATGVTAQPAAAVHKHETAPPAAVATSVTAPVSAPTDLCNPPPSGKSNETIKPKPDLDREGDGSRNVGSGRAGTGRDGQRPMRGEKSVKNKKRRSRRRGSRGGRS